MSARPRFAAVVALCLSAVLGGIGAWLLVVDRAEPHRRPALTTVSHEAGTAGTQRAGRPSPDSGVRRAGKAEGAGKPHQVRKGVPDPLVGPALPPSRPVQLRIPHLGVSSPLVELRLDGPGFMQVPQDPAVAGWFAPGPAPGALGPAVIAGHLTWNGTPGVFWRLARLRPGDAVTVARRDGRTAVFSVTRVAQYPKDRFPTEAVYGAVNHAALRLITCAGGYDSVHHRFLDNVVVFARLVAARPTPR